VEPESSLPCSQEPSTGPYPEPDQPSPTHPMSLRSILMLLSPLRLGLPSSIFIFGSPTNILHAFLFFPMCATFSVRLTTYEAPNFTYFEKCKENHDTTQSVCLCDHNLNNQSLENLKISRRLHSVPFCPVPSVFCYVAQTVQRRVHEVVFRET
jgi:hypothetical protein